MEILFFEFQLNLTVFLVILICLKQCLLCFVIKVLFLLFFSISFQIISFLRVFHHIVNKYHI